MEKILVSACLLGDKVKYNGKDNYIKEIEKLKQYYDIIPICPEMMGGLPCPRECSEIYKGRVITQSKKDVTFAFNKGASQVINIVKYLNIKKALLKEKSPSCGKYEIYDGTFSGNTIKGSGITATALEAMGVEIYNESEIEELINEKEKNN